ncbi:MAG TPA: MBL fold metallo-hydrolase [Leptospiraceae bacterium]|nr:MBL fold metallo-hydrolase [Leptospiraceae bacterium]HMW05242.1 MBL fold metallo-hydrolase [Leptospiraceae bacterium]HMX31293.1 MBL fold metallo-hydrolase [Leptospiraceae bacterium]HMY32099.1 MBL fold metallo-hydrolase [Leptospiraceae bacterium]HMZ64684.1 MBL fold metallo-hydrolase [Leptospiraceae bacterium]
MKFHKYTEIPEVEEIGTNLYKIILPQPFYAPNNIYILNGEEPALIDSGFILNLGLLQRAMKRIGLSFSNIRHIFYTHNHLDHISASLTLRSYTKARHYGMQGMAKFVGDFRRHNEAFQRTMNRLLYKAIRDPEKRKKEIQLSEKGFKELLAALKGSKKTDPILKMDVELVEGDVIDIGDRLIGFMHTPGHNMWHLSPYILGEGIYFTGDLVLQNISSIYAEFDGNLSHYHKSLERLLNLPIQRLLPAHGQEPDDPKRAIKVLIKTLNYHERGVIRRLKLGSYDLHELAVEAMGEKISGSPYYVVALAIIQSIILKLISQNHVRILEIDPPYEKYEWIGE